MKQELADYLNSETAKTRANLAANLIGELTQERDRLKGQVEQLREALRASHVSAHSLITHLECQPVFLDILKKGIPATWKMLLESRDNAQIVLKGSAP